MRNQPKGPGGGAGSLYERAAALRRRGRLEDALPLLDQLLRGNPGDARARYARAVCLTDLGRTAEAVSQLRRILDSAPRHYRAAYRLGRLLEANGDLGGAAEAYRRVPAVTGFRDAHARLRSCESTVIVPVPVPRPPARDRAVVTGAHPLGGPVITPAPPSPRPQADAHRAADRGQLVKAVHLEARHLVRLLVEAFLTAAALTVAAVAAGRLPQPTPLPTTSLLVAIVWIPFFVSLAVVLAKSRRANGADLYKYGVHVRSGLLDRSEQFIWYHQITEPPRYLRKFPDYFTRTASLGVRYNETGESSARYVELRGIGTPGQAKEVGRYIESRTPPERLPMKGRWT